jgi:plastocyanin
VNEIIIKIEIINIIINVGKTTTVTKSGQAAYTPPPPPPPPGTTTGAGAGTTTAGGAAATHTVKVGADMKLAFDPPELEAKIGDTVVFDFFAKNHTLTQSEFATPCTKDGKFDTGFNQFNPTDTDGKFLVPFKVTIDTPQWFYCAQQNPSPHCHKGMVFAINPVVNGVDKFPAFLSEAKALDGAATSAGTATTTSAGTGTTTASGTGATITVKVGAGAMLAFDPPEVDAKKGDTVLFDFFAKNHTVTQSEFATPCTPDGKFDTGFNQFNPDNVDGKFLKPFVVEDDTKPLWFYCAQQNPTPHCHKGMVFAINPKVNGIDKFPAFLSEAKALEGASTSAGTATTTSAGSGTTTASGTGATITVKVGAGAMLAFDPPEVDAKKGDTVLFDFFAKNHTVTQSEFATPCTPDGKFDTGFNQFNPDNVDGKFLKPFVVEDDSKPLWFYCAQQNPTPHCHKGMVFAINPTVAGVDKFPAFLSEAKALEGASTSAGTATTTSAGSGTTTASGTGATITVKVGAGAMLAFDPPEVDAKKGDTVLFDFFAKNHTVTQSEFATPCTPDGKFDTGFNQFNPDNVDGKFLKPFVVEDDSKPLWFYCAQQNPTPHCHKGMVFAINPKVNGIDKFPAFLSEAKALEGASTSAGTATTTSAGSGTTTASGTGATITVKVGAGAMLAFDPPEVDAKKGDTVLFDFFAKNHTVTQSEFATPCTPDGKFDTGFNQFNPDNVDGKFLKPFVVEDDTKPLWFYCAQQNPTPHCHKGMVFAINPTVAGVDKFPAFLSEAKALEGASTSAGTATTTSAGSGSTTASSSSATSTLDSVNLQCKTGDGDASTQTEVKVGGFQADSIKAVNCFVVDTGVSCQAFAVDGKTPVGDIFSSTPGVFTKAEGAGETGGSADQAVEIGGFQCETDPSKIKTSGKATGTGAGTSTTGTATGTSTGAGATYTVKVGENGALSFNPQEMQTKVGDTVVFDFFAKNHTLTQSEFATPCTKDGKFDTGFEQFNPDNVDGKFLIPFPVTVATPQWFYCAQLIPTSHCHKGMVFGLNTIVDGVDKNPAFISAAKALDVPSASSSVASSSANVASNPAVTLAPSGTSSSASVASNPTVTLSKSAVADVASNPAVTLAPSGTSSSASVASNPAVTLSKSAAADIASNPAVTLVPSATLAAVKRRVPAAARRAVYGI